MRRFLPLVIISLFLGGWAFAQAQSQPGREQPGQNQIPENQAPPRSPDAGTGESSSRDTRVDLSPPKDDAKNHPNSGIDDKNPEDEPDGVQEMHPWNPYRAMKDDEVGEFYFKRKDYKAALARYQDALIWKEKDAVANFRMAQCYEKLDQPDLAIQHYQEYLKILPQGPFAKDAHKALEKLKAPEAKNDAAEKIQSQK
jgi:tetratricopeptide (TPR) repeat protein